MTRRIDIVAGIELFPTQMDTDSLATFSYQKYQHGYEVIMHFRGERRFAFCTHENDAEFMVETLNNRDAICLRKD